MPARDVIKGKQLYRILFFGVIFTVVALGALTYWGVKEVRRDAAVVAVENSARGLAGAVTVLVNAVTSTSQDINVTNLSSDDPAKLRKAVSLILEKHKGIISIMISDETGLRYVLGRRTDGLSEIVPDKDNPTTVHRKFYASDGKATEIDDNRDFDRITLDKVLADEYAHLNPGEVNWRSAHRFHMEGEAWVTASAIIEAGGQRLMLSYILPIDSVVSNLAGAEKGGAEKIFLFWDSGKVLPVTELHDKEEQKKGFSTALDAKEVEDPVISSATALLENEKNQSAPFALTVDGQVWWAYVYPLSVFGDTMSLGVVVPLRNVVSTLTSDTFLQVFGGVLVLFAASVLLVIRKNRTRIEALGLRQKAARNPEDILRLIADGESSKLEFKQTLRFNLKSGKNGKEIEHASLKTVAGFLNSEGGTLLIGVADNGAVTGFEEDKLGNDDKALLHFNNLVNQSIGTEFARYIDTKVIEVQGEHIMRVYCIPAAAPAILRNGKNEEFYVRSGPASRQLTLSQFYEWLQNH